MQMLRLFALVPLLLTGCTIGHRITRFDSSKPVTKGDQAVYYALPRTVVTASFQVKKTEVVEGPKVDGTSCFSELGNAADFLVTRASGGIPKCGADYCLWQVIGLDEAPAAAGAKYKLVGTPVLATAAEPDPAEIFRVDLGSSAFTKRQVELTYGPLGLLESGTSLAQDRRVDIALAAVQSALKLFPLLAFQKSVQPPARPPRALNRCQEAAKKIQETRESLDQLASQIGPPPGRSAKETLLLEELYKRRIAENVAVFLANKETSGVIGCAARPVKGATNPMEVLHLDVNSGFKEGRHADCNVPSEFATRAAGATLYQLRVGRTADDHSDSLERADVHRAHTDGEKQGFYYRVPASARAVLEEVSTNTVTLTEADLTVAQLGIVAALPVQRTYQTKYTVTLDPQTGALRKLIADSEAIDPKLITDTGTALSDAMEAEAERKKAEAAAEDELALLERERKILGPAAAGWHSPVRRACDGAPAGRI